MNLGSFVKCMFLNMSIFNILIIIFFFLKNLNLGCMLGFSTSTICEFVSVAS